MEMHQIRYFLAVAEALNFTRAADACNVAQPSLSRAIGKLEEEFGGALFRRERGHTHLTELGRSMLPMLRQSYDAARAAKVEADRYKEGEYAPLRLGLSLTVNGSLVAKSLAELSNAFPGLHIVLRRGPAEDILGALRAGDIEVAIAAESETGWDRFDSWPLFEEGFVLVTPPDHALARRKSIEFEDLVGERIVLRPYCEDSERFAEARTAAAGSVANVGSSHEIANDDDAIVWARHGLGLAMLPASVGRTDGTAVTHLSESAMTRKVMLYGVAGRQRSPALGSFMSLLRAADWSLHTA